MVGWIVAAAVGVIAIVLGVTRRAALDGLERTKESLDFARAEGVELRATIGTALPFVDAKRLQDRYRQAVIERDTLQAANTTLLLERNKLQAQVNRLLDAVDDGDVEADPHPTTSGQFVCTGCGSRLAVVGNEWAEFFEAMAVKRGGKRG